MYSTRIDTVKKFSCNTVFISKSIYLYNATIERPGDYLNWDLLIKWFSECDSLILLGAFYECFLLNIFYPLFKTVLIPAPSTISSCCTGLFSSSKAHTIAFIFKFITFDGYFSNCTVRYVTAAYGFLQIESFAYSQRMIRF